MNKTLAQKIYKRAVVEQMRSDLRSGESLETYFKESFPVKEKDLLPSTIVLQGKAPILKTPKSDPVSADVDNAMLLYEHYRNLDETQASDPRLWVYLSHIEFRKYTLNRWGLDGTFKDLKDPAEKTKAINKLLDHWFINGNDRDLRRHAIARLWWAAHLTYAPWESDPEFFGDLKNKDPYHYTRILFSTQDIYQQVLERAMGRSNRILISVLDFLGKNKGFARSRENIRTLMKELNLAYGTKKIITLERQALMVLIEKMAKEIESA
ncbi:MAG: hypothetical protein KBD50_03710 [Candidatus Pacebacteria bacterium]|nr:hypothetical protein [Candidatus Paceibacterota bacterium]